MAKLSKNIDIKDLFAKFGKNTAWLFVAGLLILCIFDVLEIKKSVSIILSGNVEPKAALPEHDIRVDFDGYYKVLQRKQDAQNYYSTTTPTVSPFGTGQ
jgi:hypothetical protein